ncbi:MAG: DUF4139 domain-containing protein [Candidatus Bipolaricaulota bacterium]
MLDRKDGSILFVLTLFLLGLVQLTAFGEVPADRTIITVYQNGPSLVVKREGVELDQGVNELSRVIPSSALTKTIFLDVPDGTVKNFRVVPSVNKESGLLERFVGEEIAVYKSGDDNSVEGTLIDLIGGKPLLKSSDGEFSLIRDPGEYRIKGISPELHENTLKVKLISDERKESSLTLGYHLNGLDWSPQYVGFLDEGKGKLGLRGVAHISNDTGWSFEQAKLYLLAGSPAREEAEGVKFFAARNVSEQDTSAPESVFDYYRYPVDYRLDLTEGTKTQVKFLRKDAVDYHRYYRYEPAVSSAVASVIVLTNTEEKGLGLPLASGTVRIYDNTEERTFLGADSLPNLPEGNSAELDLGKTFDVKGERKRTSHTKLDDEYWEDQVTIELTNRKDQPVTVKVIERLPGSWEIISFDRDFEKIDSKRIQCEVKVPSDGTARISYTVRYQY